MKYAVPTAYLIEYTVHGATRLLPTSVPAALTERLLEEGRRTAALDAAVDHDGDAVGEELRLVHVVGRHQDGPSLLHPLQDRPHLLAGVGVQSGRRLVQDQHLTTQDSQR